MQEIESLGALCGVRELRAGSTSVCVQEGGGTFDFYKMQIRVCSGKHSVLLQYIPEQTQKCHSLSSLKLCFRLPVLCHILLLRLHTLGEKCSEMAALFKERIDVLSIRL